MKLMKIYDRHIAMVCAIIAMLEVGSVYAMYAPSAPPLQSAGAEYYQDYEEGLPPSIMETPTAPPLPRERYAEYGIPEYQPQPHQVVPATQSQSGGVAAPARRGWLASLGFARRPTLVNVPAVGQMTHEELTKYVMAQPNIAERIIQSGLSKSDILHSRAANKAFSHGFSHAPTGKHILSGEDMRPMREAFEQSSQAFHTTYPTPSGAELSLADNGINFGGSWLGRQVRAWSALYKLMQSVIQRGIQSDKVPSSTGYAPIFIRADNISIGSLPSPKVFVDTIADYTKQLYRPGFDRPIIYSLSMSRNAIKRLEPGTFAKLPSLRELNLAWNDGLAIDKGAFEGLSALESLELTASAEFLQHLDPAVFAPLRNLKRLKFHTDSLISVDPVLVEQLHTLLPRANIEFLRQGATAV